MFELTAVPSDYQIERDKPMPSKNHAIIQANLLLAIQPKYAQQFRVLPEINLGLPIRDRVPDLAIYPPIEYVRGADEIKMTQVPLGVIEILSPMQNVSELMQKREEYFTAGVKSYWIVVPDLDTVYVFNSPEDYEAFHQKETLRDQRLGIELPLADIFK